MISQEEAFNFMVKKLTNEISRDELTHLEQWLDVSEENKKAYRDLERIWDSAEQEPLTVDTDAAWQKVHKRITHKTIQFNFMFSLKVAAVLLAVSILGILAYNNLAQGETTIQTAANEIKKVSLPDGSSVWLHEHSSLTFNNDLRGDQRAVSLRGLAFFDVQRDEKKPFVIGTPKGSVEVLGTSFEVSAYKNDSFERVTVSTGKVKFENHRSGKSMLLTRDMQGLLTNSGTEQAKEVKAAELVSWKAGKLTFNNETMDKVAEKIERYFHVQLILKNDAIANCRFTAAFENGTLKEVLDAMSKALQLTYSQQANRIIINGQGCKAQ